MTAFIFALTVRQLAGRRSALILAGLALLPLLVALVSRLGPPEDEPERWAARQLFGLVVTAVLPLIALLLGTSVLGDELEEGTAIYLLTKPLNRWQILLPKFAAAAGLTAALTAPSYLLAGFVALQGHGEMSLLPGFTLALVVGSVAYTAVFVLLSLVTSRALIAGLVYVFVWEAMVTALFTGTRYFSIRHYTLALADWFSGVPDRVLEAQMSGPLALALAVVVAGVALAAAERRLEEVEVREAT